MFELAKIANNIQKQGRSISHTVVAVVSDVTRPLYREQQKNYIVMLKIIDQSLNDKQLFGVMSKDCCVYLISKNKKQIDFIDTIGQIVLLDKFVFSLWNGIKLQTKYLYMTEGIYKVSLDADDELQIKGQFAMNPALLDKSDTMIRKVKQLMEWRTTKMPQIQDPKIGVNILNSHCVMIQPFNMILCYQGKIDQQVMIKKSQEEEFILKLCDANKNYFYVKHRNDKFEPGELLMIRGIQSINNAHQIQLTLTGNVLRFSYRIDYLSMNYMAIHRDNQRFKMEEKKNMFSIVNSQNADITFIKTLVDLQDKYDHSNRKQQIDVRDTYFLKVVAINYEGILTMFHREFQILLHDGFYEALSANQKSEYKEYNRIGYVYQGVIGLLDRSNEASGKPFNVNLFTNDTNGNFMSVQDFEKAERAIGTSQQTATRKQLHHLIQSKLNKISTQSTFLNPICLIVESVKSEKLLFRVANTKFL